MTETEAQKLYIYQCDAGHIARIGKMSFVLLLLMTGSFLLTGSYSSECMGDIAVLLSWFICLFPLVMGYIGIWNFMKQSPPITQKQKKKGPERLLHSGAYFFLLSAVCVFCCIYYILTHECESPATEAGMVLRAMLQCIVSGGLLILMRRTMARIEEDREPACETPDP